MELKGRTVDGVIYAITVDRKDRSVTFAARLPEYVEMTAQGEYDLRRRIHDGMEAALLPLFGDRNEAAPE